MTDSEQTLGPMRSAFSFLEREYGFRPVHEEYLAEFFGNAVLQFATEQLMVQVICDRNQYFCRFGSPTDPQVCFAEATILQALEENVDYQSLVQSKWASLYNLATIVQRHFPRIIAMFATEMYPTTRSTLITLRRRHLEETLGYEPKDDTMFILRPKGSG